MGEIADGGPGASPILQAEREESDEDCFNSLSGRRHETPKWETKEKGGDQLRSRVAIELYLAAEGGWW